MFVLVKHLCYGQKQNSQSFLRYLYKVPLTLGLKMYILIFSRIDIVFEADSIKGLTFVKIMIYLFSLKSN